MTEDKIQVDGLTREEWNALKQFIRSGDYGTLTMQGANVNGVKLPTILDGKAVGR